MLTIIDYDNSGNLSVALANMTWKKSVLIYSLKEGRPNKFCSTRLGIEVV